MNVLQGSNLTNAGRAALVGARGGALAAGGLAVGLPLAAALSAATAGLWAFREGLIAANEASRFSSRVAASQQIAQRQRLFGDIRRATSGENELAAFSLARADLGEEIRDLKHELLRNLLPKVTAILQSIDQGIELVRAVDEKTGIISEAPEAVGEVVARQTGVSPELVEKVLEYFEERRREEADKRTRGLMNELEDFLDPVRFKFKGRQELRDGHRPRFLRQ